MKIFLCGHGGWNPGDGYAKVPAGSTLTFYTQNAKLLKGGDDYKVIAGHVLGAAGFRHPGLPHLPEHAPLSG